jgi:peptide/nickel transport system ATP-binding protein
MPLLEVDQLHITLDTARGRTEAVRGISFTLERGATLGLIGESGSGKSLTAMALMGLLPSGASTQGSIRFDNHDLLTLNDRQLSALRGQRMAMVFQEPMTALNPVHRVGDQVAEPLRIHLGLDRGAAHARAVQLLERVGIAQAAQRANDYPHQFSGGQRQRITIAMALACGPDLLIADEPTTALDVTVQQQILQLLQELVAEHRMALLLVSHDLAVMAHQVQQLLVMYAGSVVEQGNTRTVLRSPAHPYTRGLLAARPRWNHSQQGPLPTIAGQMPDLVDLPPGCAFAGRCPHTLTTCWSEAPLLQPLPAASTHLARCLRADVLHAPQAL